MSLHATDSLWPSKSESAKNENQSLIRVFHYTLVSQGIDPRTETARKQFCCNRCNFILHNGLLGSQVIYFQHWVANKKGWPDLCTGQLFRGFISFTPQQHMMCDWFFLMNPNQCAMCSLTFYVSSEHAMLHYCMGFRECSPGLNHNHKTSKEKYLRAQSDMFTISVFME